MWLRVSPVGSNEYATFGELLNRLDLAGSVWRLGRYQYIYSLVELVAQHKLQGLIGSSRRHFFALIGVLVQRGLEKHERIRELKRLIHSLLMVLTQDAYVGSRFTLYAELDLVRQWLVKINNIRVIPKLDTGATMSYLPVYVQRHIVRLLDDPEDIESLSLVNSTLETLCNEPSVWRSLCLRQFTMQQIWESEKSLERKPQATHTDEPCQEDQAWKRRYSYLLRKFEKREHFSDPLLLCRRCKAIFWQDSGHPCIDETSTRQYEHIAPKRLMSLLNF